jgi:hypothetical protein
MSPTALRRLAGAAVVLLALGASGCLYYHESSSSSSSGSSHGKRGHGPPDWAPAHGARYKHASGVTLVFDSGLGIYVVAELPGTYFQDERFYRRLANGGWGVAAWPNGPWSAVGTGALPPGLRASAAPGVSITPGQGRKLR